MFKVKDSVEILITGGTGSLGKALIRYLITQRDILIKGIRVYSRDELKQLKLKDAIGQKTNIPIEYIIGDVRDYKRIYEAMRGVDICYHTAALKQVPTAEDNPIEYIETNVVGTENVVRACYNNNVKKAILVSTDKAVEPINLYGGTKLVAEKLWVNASKYNGNRTVFLAVRYGNVLGSRGSIVDVIKNNKSNTINVTDPTMSRFWIKIRDVVRFIFIVSTVHNETGCIFVPKMMSCKLGDFLNSITDNKKWNIVGRRNGEKVDEMLINQEEIDRAIKVCFLDDTNKKYEYIIIHPYFYKTIENSNKLKSPLFSNESNPNFTNDKEKIRKYCL
jgi:UDP-N-acetylglucosamine 4,6-dehydratase/5-epimerase